MLTKADISRLRSLRDKKQREALGLFVVEGAKVVAELMTAGFAFQEIYATDPSLVAGECEFIEVTVSEMERISHYPTPSSLFAVGRLQRKPVCRTDLLRGLTLALDGVQDAGNVGTLLRIADWFRLDRVVLSTDSADLFSQKVINASMGSFARVQVHTATLAEVLPVDIPVLGCDLNGTNVHTLQPVTNAVLVIGSEGRGLSPEVRARVTAYVTIPKYGHAESLNAGIAAAIICDNLRRLEDRST